MAIDTTITPSYLLPLVNIATDGSQAGLLSDIQPALLIGQKLSTGSATIAVPTPIGSPAIAAQLYGLGSMLERMVTAFFANNQTQQLWAVPCPDPVSGIAASGSITFTSVATSSGILYTYIAGQLVTIPVYTQDTLPIIAARLSTAINATPTLPVTATNATNSAVVTLIARHVGDLGNDIQVTFNNLGQNGGQSTPVGLAVTVVPMTGGNGQPDLTGVIANIASQSFVHVACPYSDTASLSEMDVEFGFGLTGRWNFLRAQYGWVYNAHRADYADSLQWGIAHNSRVITTMAMEITMPTPVWEVVASYCAVGAYYLTDDPCRPLQTLVLNGVQPAPLTDRYTKGEMNNLTYSGLAVQSTNPSGSVAIEREALQYQFNDYGQRDTAFALLTELSNLAELNNRFAQGISSKYPRVKLAPDGTKLGPGQAAVTPTIVKTEIIAIAIQAVYDGIMSDLQDFKDNLLVEIDDTNPNRLNVLLAPQLMGQLRQVNILNQFRLLYNTNIISQS